MKLSEATKLVTILAAYFPNRDVPKETFQLWAVELESFDARDGMEAVRELAADSKFMPSLAELLGAIDDHRKVRVDRETANRLALNGESYDFEGWLKASEANPHKPTPGGADVLAKTYTAHKCLYCGLGTHSVCNDGHARVWLCPPEMRDCFLRHRSDGHDEQFLYREPEAAG